MSTDLMKKILCRYYEAFNRGDFTEFDHIIADDYVEHEALPPRISPCREGMKDYMRLLRNAFPDIKFDIRDLVAENDKVWAHVVMKGTQRRDYRGIPATGKRVEMEMVDIFRFSGTQVVEHWSIAEQHTMVQQLGMVSVLVSEDL